MYIYWKKSWKISLKLLFKKYFYLTMVEDKAYYNSNSPVFINKFSRFKIQ